MGKGKGKGKLKTYKTPDAKYLVVVDPWGTPGNSCFINNVAAWFELMLKDDYPGEEVRTIFTQGTHNNIIVELALSVDILPYLGAHHHARFLTPDYERERGVSYIYEYDYETQGDPTRRSWKANCPTNYNITRVPIRQPYPLPLPAPPPPYHAVYAKRLRNIPPAAEALVNDPPPNNIPVPQTASIPSLQPPQQRLETNVLIKKQDPYEKEEDDERLLTNTSPSLSVKQEGAPPCKEEPITHQVPSSKLEHEDTSLSIAAHNFLNSIFPVKKEVSTDTPSVKLGGEVNNDVYQPSAELLAAFNNLPPNMFNQAFHVTSTKPEIAAHPAKKEPLQATVNEDNSSRRFQTARSTAQASEVDKPNSSSVRIKPEPREYELPSLFQSAPREMGGSDERGRERSLTLGAEVKPEGSIDRVKLEPTIEAFSLGAISREKTQDPRLGYRDARRTPQLTPQVKPEPRDVTLPLSIQAVNSAEKTRDPRLVIRAKECNKRPSEDESERGMTKRIKPEPDW